MKRKLRPVLLSQGVQPKNITRLSNVSDSEPGKVSWSLFRVSLYLILIFSFTFVVKTRNKHVQDVKRIDLAIASKLVEYEHSLSLYKDSNVNEYKDMPPQVCIAGIVRDASRINKKIWESLYILNCIHDFAVHMIVGSRLDEVKLKRKKLWDAFSTQMLNTNMSTREADLCAPFFILHDSSNDSMLGKNHQAMDNRIEKISLLRDYQRQLLRSYFGDRIQSTDSVVVVVDFDLLALPQSNYIVALVRSLQQPNFHYDAVCSAGVTVPKLRRKNENDKMWYYDTFSTVLLPDTFIHPLSKRMIPNFYPAENRKLVRSNNQYGEVTQGDLMQYFVNEGKHSSYGMVGVRSCFGGMTAYKASIYFAENCQYTLGKDALYNVESDTVMRYAGKKDKRPCEHVVFHECLRRQLANVNLAVDPGLITYWRKN